jgi:hypothetical protein
LDNLRRGFLDRPFTGEPKPLIRGVLLA